MKKYINITKIVQENNLDPDSIVLVTNHIMAKCLKKDKWIICHIKGETLLDCREYENLDDAIEVIKSIMNTLKGE